MDAYARTLQERLSRQLVGEGHVRTTAIAEGFRTVPRHVFLPNQPIERVYTNEAFVTRTGSDGSPASSSSQPGIMAIMLEQLQAEPGDKILEIGAGTGYNAAILAYLAGPEGAVITVDIDPTVVDEARAHLLQAGYDRVQVVAADGWMGRPDAAPFDRIEATVGIWDLSPHWVDQMQDGGVLVVPLWLRAGLQASVAFQKSGTYLRSLSVAPCGFMRLRGPHAGPEGFVRVGEWLVRFDGPSEEWIEIVQRLLAETPRRTALDGLPKGWFLPVAFEEPGAISMGHVSDWRRERRGIFDPSRGGLAVVEGEALISCGDEAATVRLHERLHEGRAVIFRVLQVEAFPSRTTVDAAGRWVLQRPHFTFALGPTGFA